MPGIAGIISKKPRWENVSDLNLMIGCMMHEPFYNSGSYTNENLGLYAGWVTHKGSFTDCMPVINSKKDIILLFSGENFVDSYVVNGLKKQGHEIDGSNAGYLIHLYEEDPEKFFQCLNGYFSGIIVDLKQKKIILFNDRYRMGRIYYHENNEEFIFSSEAKSLLKIRPELRNIDLESLAQFFTWDCVLQERTFFKNIFLLPGGSQWTFTNGTTAHKKTYFEPSVWESKPALDKDIFNDRLKETFLNILPRYFGEKEHIAMSVSSGLDTRAIMACLDVSPGELPCHTFSGINRETLDAIIGRKIVEAWHQPHEVLRLDRNFLSDFPDLSQKTVYITDGCLNVNGTYDIYFNELVRKIRPIRMTGKFGSEIIRSRSVLRNPFVFSDGIFNADFADLIDLSFKTLNVIKSGHELSFAAFKEIPWIEYGRLAIEMSKLTVRTPYMDNELVELLYQAPQGARDSVNIILQLVEHGNPALLDFTTDIGTASKNMGLFSKFAKFYYYSLVKSEYIYLNQLPHWLTKIEKVFSPLHPEKLFAGRHQLGYYRMWYRDVLSDYIRDVLLDNRTTDRPFLNKNYIEHLVNSHIKGHGNYTGVINKILTVELLHRLLIEDI